MTLQSYAVFSPPPSFFLFFVSPCCDTRPYLRQIEEKALKSVAKPKKIENVALLYVAPLEYYNGASSEKHASFLKDKMDNNPYYYLTEDKDLADYVVLPKLLKAKVDALDDAHKRLQMVVAVEISGLEDNLSVASQNRFLLFSKGDNEQEIAAKLLKKLLEACAMEAMRKIEIKEQQKLEQNAIGHTF